MTTKTLSVSAIHTGTVIDHIPRGRALKILQILHLRDEQPVTFGTNLKSDSMKSKDLIKIENCKLTESQLEQIAIFAPTATINEIHDYEVLHKHKTQMPELMDAILTCPNPRCVTRHENIRTKFTLDRKEFTPRLRCEYCTKVFTREEVGRL